MLCQNCGKHEGNIKYTQIINGVKKEMILCEECAKEFGIDEINFNMPINFSSFLGDLLEEYNDSSFLPSFIKKNTLKCDNCGLTYEEFIENGKFGCENCYEAFNEKINYLVKNLHGTSSHVGRKPKYLKENNMEINKEETKENSKIEKLKKELNQAVKEERYEDAAKIRDQIKEIEK